MYLLVWILTPPKKKKLLNLQVFCTSDHIINTYLLSCKDSPMKIESCNSLKNIGNLRDLIRGYY